MLITLSCFAQQRRVGNTGTSFAKSVLYAEVLPHTHPDEPFRNRHSEKSRQRRAHGFSAQTSRAPRLRAHSPQALVRNPFPPTRVSEAPDPTLWTIGLNSTLAHTHSARARPDSIGHSLYLCGTGPRRTIRCISSALYLLKPLACFRDQQPIASETHIRIEVRSVRGTRCKAAPALPNPASSRDRVLHVAAIS